MPPAAWRSTYLNQAKVWLRAPAGADPITARMLKVTRNVGTPWDANGNPDPNLSTSSNSPISVETFTIPASERNTSGAFISETRESSGVELLPTLTYEARNEKRTAVSLRDIRIVPAANMVGVVGDMIPSNQTLDPQLHFVTPKKPTLSPDIPDDYVVFEATGLFESEIKNGHKDQLVKWVNGEEVPNEPLKRRVKRDQTGKTELKIITSNASGDEVAKVNVWVVWTNATIVRKYNPVHFTISTQGNFQGSSYGTEGKTTAWQFKFKIDPPEIVSLATGSDRPRLEGPNSTPVPGRNKPHNVETTRDADDATVKWDVSRQLEIHISNPQLIPKANFPQQPELFKNQPKAIDPALAFPTNPVEGNDDPGGPL